MKYIEKMGSVRILLSIVCILQLSKCITSMLCCLSVLFCATSDYPYGMVSPFLWSTWVHLPVFSGVRVTRSLVLCVCFVDRCLYFCAFFLLATVLSVLLFTDSDDPYGIFKLFFGHIVIDLIRTVLCRQHVLWSSYCSSF